jgi:hypothetical protein
MPAVEKRLALGEDAAADAIARIDDGDRGPFCRELTRGRETGQPGPGDENGSAAHPSADSVREVQPDEREIAHRLAFMLPRFLVVHPRNDV